MIVAAMNYMEGDSGLSIRLAALVAVLAVDGCDVVVLGMYVWPVHYYIDYCGMLWICLWSEMV